MFIVECTGTICALGSIVLLTLIAVMLYQSWAQVSAALNIGRQRGVSDRRTAMREVREVRVVPSVPQAAWPAFARAA